jgi:branched-chain amino acid transport system permease protein
VILKRADAVLLGLCVIVIVVVVPFMTSDYWIFTFGTVGAVAISVIGLNVALGWAGLLSFGQPVFMAIGGYSTAILTTRYHVNPWLALVCGMVFAMVFAAIIGVPVLRLESHYFAVSTFAMSLIVLSVVNGAQEFTGGAIGISAIPPLTIGGTSFRDHTPYYVLVWILVGASLLFTYAVRASRTGRAFRVLASRPDVAESLGIQVRRYRVIAFVISGMLGALSGSLIVEYSTYASPDNFNGDVGILVIAMLFIGGARTASGPLVGAGIVTIVPVVATSIGKYSALSFEVVLMLILVIYPQGLGIGVAEGVEKAIQSVLGRAGVGKKPGSPHDSPGAHAAPVERLETEATV